MKYILSILGVGIICLSIFFCGGKKDVNQDYMRVHVVANSNSKQDQDIKYFVKDVLVEYLEPKLSEAQNKNEVKTILYENLPVICEIVDSILLRFGANYRAKVEIISENFPARSYDNLVLAEGVYDSLKVDLGAAKGDNWWCVVFPSVCFISKNPENYDYISKILEIIQSVTSKKERK